jgi:hypothetical protein
MDKKPPPIPYVPFPGIDPDLLETLEWKHAWKHRARSVGEIRTDEASLTYQSLYNFPEYILAEIDRLIAGTRYTREEAMMALLDKGIEHLDSVKDKRIWADLRETAKGRRQPYRDAEDFDQIVRLTEDFRFSIPDLHTRCKRQYNMRLTHDSKSQLAGLATKLGVSQSVLGQLLILDGLSTEEGLIHSDDIRGTVDDFYRKLKKRVRQLVCYLKGMDIDLSEDLQQLFKEHDL